MEEPKPHFLTPKCSSLSPTFTSKYLFSKIVNSNEQSYCARFLPIFKLSLKQLSTDIEKFELKKQDQARCYKDRTSVKSRLVEAAKGDQVYNNTKIERTKHHLAVGALSEK